LVRYVNQDRRGDGVGDGEGDIQKPFARRKPLDSRLDGSINQSNLSIARIAHGVDEREDRVHPLEFLGKVGFILKVGYQPGGALDLLAILDDVSHFYRKRVLLVFCYTYPAGKKDDFMLSRSNKAVNDFAGNLWTVSGVFSQS